MYALCRIVNGVSIVMMIGLLTYLAPLMPVQLRVLSGLWIFTSALLYLCDVCDPARSSRSVSDIRFMAFVWMLWFGIVGATNFLALQSIGFPSLIPGMTGVQFAVLSMFIGYALPLLVNCINYVQLLGKNTTSNPT